MYPSCMGSLSVAKTVTELVLAAHKVLIVGDFNIHVDNEKYALESAFLDILNSSGLDNTCQDLLIVEIIL